MMQSTVGRQDNLADRSVLIIDDDETILDLLQEFLRMQGFSVDTASCAEEAIQQLKQCPYNAIITDLNLPGASGMELLKQVRLDYPETTVVVVTGYGTIETAVTALLRTPAACRFDSWHGACVIPPPT